MSWNNGIDGRSLDRYITGNYGEDQFRDCLEDETDVSKKTLGEVEDMIERAGVAAHFKRMGDKVWLIVEVVA